MHALQCCESSDYYNILVWEECAVYRAAPRSVKADDHVNFIYTMVSSMVNVYTSLVGIATAQTRK